MQSFSGKPFPQREIEIATLRDLAFVKGCRSILEIGSRYGDSFYYLASALGPGSYACAVDLPGGAWGNADSADYLEKARKALVKKWGVEAHVLLGNSRDPQMIAEVSSRGPFDLVFIDGDHSLDGVRADWETYGPLAEKLVAFHDIDADAKEPRKAKRYGVPELWRQIKKSHSTVEIVSAEREMGIGVVIRE